MLRKFYKKNLCLRSKSLSLAETEAKPKTGLVIWFKTPEQIKEPDFDLCEHLETLTACFAVAETSDNVDLLLRFEVKMSNKVFSRDDVASDEYTYDQSDQICVFNSMLACQYLYEKRFKEAEEHLKTACRMIPKRSRFPARLLCKVISYVTWLFLDMDKLDEMKLMLDAGLEFIVQKPAQNIKLESNFVPPPPLKRFEGFMLKMIQWANFLARVPSLDVDSSY